MGDNLRSKTVRGLKWSTIDSVAQNIFQVIVGLILAHFVNIDDFGIIAILTIFIVLANLFQDSGFGVALTRKKEITNEEYSSVFYFSVVLSILIYLTLFFSVDLISSFQGKPVPANLARVLFLTFLVSSFGIVPYVILSREVDYKSITYSNLLALIISNTAAIILAWFGFGAWALCIQTVSYHAIRVFSLFLCSKWKPLRHFSFKPLKEMLGFSSKLMFTYILYTLANNITSNLIDKYFNRTEAGYYSQANRWYNKPILFFTLPIATISLPVMSKVNDEHERQRRIFRKIIKTMSFVAFPLSIIFAYITPEFIMIFLREKWISVTPYMQLLCLGTVFVPFDTILFNLMNSRAKSGALFIFSLLKNILLISAIFLSIKHGIITLIIASGIVNYLFFLALSYYCIRLVGCRIRDYMKDTLPYLFIPLLLITVMHITVGQIQNSYTSLLIKSVVPASLYLLIMYCGKSEVLMEGKGYIEKFIHKKRDKIKK